MKLIWITGRGSKLGYRVSFSTALELMETPELAELKGELKKEINQLRMFDSLSAIILSSISTIFYIQGTPRNFFTAFRYN